MKRFILAIIIISASMQLQAQYKKVGYFGKGGRTYQVGAAAHFFGDGKGSPIGFYFGSGSDRPEKHLISWHEIEIMSPIKFQYETTGFDFRSQAYVPLKVSGKSKAHLLYNYNIGYHFLDRSEEEPMFQPFAYLGLNFVLFGRTDPPDFGDLYDVKKDVSEGGFRLGVRGGLGLSIKLNDLIQIKTLTGYNQHFDFNKPDIDGHELYIIYSSHLYVSTGIQFRLAER